MQASVTIFLPWSMYILDVLKIILSQSRWYPNSSRIPIIILIAYRILEDLANIFD